MVIIITGIGRPLQWQPCNVCCRPLKLTGYVVHGKQMHELNKVIPIDFFDAGHL